MLYYLAPLCHQFREGPLRFQHYNIPEHEARSIKKWCQDCYGTTYLHRALTSILFNILWMNWNLNANITVILLVEWEQIPEARLQNLVGSNQRRV